MGEAGIDLQLSLTKLAAILRQAELFASSPELLSLHLPATKVRRGHQLRLVIPGPQVLNIIPQARDEKLVALIAEAHQARKLMQDNPDRSLASIAASANRCRTRLGKLASLSCLAPDIVTAIVEGRQPSTLTARTLLATELPLAWPQQRAMLGFS